MDHAAALAFVETHGVVLASARGPVPTLTEAIAGGPIKGSWWAHPQGKRIFAVLGALADAPEILVCRVVGGKISYVHRRVWPALVRLAPRLAAANLARVRQEHTAAGRHQNREEPFPDWVPAAVMKQAGRLSEDQALGLLGQWVLAPVKAGRSRVKK